MEIFSILFIFYGCLFFLFLLLSVYVIYSCFGYAPYQFFKRQGIPGPKPKPFIGNLDLIMRYKGDQFAMNDMLSKKYGKVYGLYFATRPFLFISDLDAIREVAIKQFDKFINRMNQSGGFRLVVEGQTVDGIFVAPGEEWRKRRRALSPAFSGHKLKLMEPLIKESTVRLAEKISVLAEKGETVEVLGLYNKMTMEVILSTAFGKSVDVQGGKGGEIYEAACGVFSAFTGGNSSMRAIQFILMCFPFLDPVLHPLISRTRFGVDLNYLITTCTKMVDERRQDQSTVPNRKDLLQLMLNAGHKEAGDGLTNREIVADAVGFLLAGYETTSTVLTFTTYLLAYHPEVQKKLCDEICEYFADNPSKSLYDVAQEVEYLDMVLSEALRMYSPAPGMVRLCNEDCIIEGMRIKKGCQVVLMARKVHYDPEIWPEPNRFDPQRFTAEEKAKRHPCAYLPFGLGPRNCVGMRFALMEAKMALIEIVRNFKIELSPETKVPLEVELGHVLRVKHGLYVIFRKINA